MLSPRRLKEKSRQRRRKLFVEALEDRRLLAITPGFSAGVLTFTGDGADDTLVLEATANPSTVNYDDGGGLGSTTQAGVTRVEFNGFGGEDQLIISHAGGNIFAPASGIQFNGGAGDDEVILGEGNAATFNGTYTPSGPEAGNLSYTSGGDTQSLDMDDVESLQDATIAAALTTDIGGVSSDIDIIDGPLPAPVSSIVQGPIVIDGGDRDDHGSFSSGANQDGWKFMEQMLDYVLQESFITTATKDLLVIGANSFRALDAIQNVVGAGGLNLASVDFITSTTDIMNVDFTQYQAFYVPSDTNTSGGITQTQVNALATRTADITSFVRDGGGIVALTEENTTNPYSWLAIPDPFVIGNTSRTDQRQTTFMADAFAAASPILSITNTELSNGTPTHNHFVGPAGFNGLDPWVVYPGSPGQIVDAANGGEYSPDPTNPGGSVVSDPTPGDDEINVLGQGAINTSVGGGQSMEINDSGTGSFLTIRTANKTTVDVTNNPSGADDILIDLTTANKADGLTTLNVGSTAGGDSYDVQGTPAGVVTTINGSSGNDDVTVEQGGLDGQLDLLLGGGPGDSLQVNSTGGADTIGVTPTQVTHNSAANINFNADLESIGVFGDADNDIFNVTPSDTASIFIDGGAPTVFMGDELHMDFTGLSATPPTLTTGAPREGEYSFPGMEMPVEYTDIEDVNANGDYHLIFDATRPGSFGNDATADEVTIDVIGPDLRIRRTGPGAPMEEFFRGDISRILSLTYQGSGDDDIVTIDETTGGLPDFGGTVPGAPDNPNIPGAPDMLLNGDGGNDALNYEFGGGTTYDQTYALGDGVGGGFGADVGTAEGEILTENGASLQLYFTGLEPITTLGVPGGTLTVLGDGENQLIQVLDAEDSTQAPAGAVGFTRVQAFNENRDTEPFEFSPYEFFDFAADAFTELVINGLGGDDILDFISFDPAETGAGLATLGVDLLGDDGDDVISVITNSDGADQLGIEVFGEAGDDEVVIADFGAGSRVGAQTERVPSHSVTPILGVPVLVDGGSELDTLRVDDTTGAGHSYEFTSGGTLPLAIGRGGAGAVEYDGSIEDVTLESGDFSDTFLVGDILPSPAVTRIIDGDGTADLIDFTPFAGPSVQWDMDTAAVQDLSGVAAAGPLLQVVGTVEDFDGSTGDDTVYVDALPGVPRDLLGDAPAPGDTLIYDPLGETATDDGATVTFSGGLGPITYAEFSDALAWDTVGAGPFAMDNLDPGFASGPSPFTAIATQVTPFGPDIVASSPAVDIDDNAGTGADVGDGSTDTATWTFEGLPNGWYAVAATWTAAPGQATDAEYLIHDGLTAADDIIGGSTVNQEQDPGDYNVGGTEWRPLDYVRVTSNSLTVSLSDDVTDRPGTSDTVLADAVLLELLPPSFLVDDGDPEPAGTVDPADFSASGGTSLDNTTLGRFNDVHVIGAASGDTATYTSEPGLPAGSYLISSTWVQPNTYAFDATYTVNGADVFVTNQDHSPDSFTLGGVPWEALGVVTIDGSAGVGGDTIEVVLSDSAGRPVAADGILIQPISDVLVTTEAGAVMDGGTYDFGSTRIGEVVYETFTVTNTGLAPLELSDLTVAGTLMNNLAIAGGFELTDGPSATTVPAGGSATFEVRFGPDILSANPTDPNYPTDPFLQGPHEGLVSFTSNAFDPHFQAALAGEVGQPDAVILDNAPHNLPGMYQDPNGGTYARGDFIRWSGQQGYLNDVAYSAAGSGATATWDFTGVGLPAGTYQVAATWSAHPNRATDAPYTVTTTPAGSTTVDVDQEAAPGDFTSDGGSWEVLGTFEVGADGVLTVTLTDAADEFVIADAIRVQQVDLQVVDLLDEAGVVDDGDDQFTVVGGTPFTYNGANNAFQNDLFYFDSGSGGSAEWDFHVDPGGYLVGVSWQEHSNRNTDAEYTISSPGGVLADFTTFGTIDQTLPAAADQTGAGTVILDGKRFQILARVEVPALDKQISLSLSDAGSGFLIADAAFVMRVSDPSLPLTPAEGPATELVGAPLTRQQLDEAVGTAVDAWLATDLTERQLRGLESLDVRLSPIGGSELGFASPTTGRVFIDRDGAGLGYGAGGYDPLSVVSHEIGHILGLPDLHDPGSQGDVMGATLGAGVSRLPSGGLSGGSLADAALSAPLGDGGLLDSLAGERLSLDSQLDGDLLEGDKLADYGDARVDGEPSSDKLAASPERDALLSLLLDESRRRRHDEVDAVFGQLDEAEDGDDGELL